MLYGLQETKAIDGSWNSCNIWTSYTLISSKVKTNFCLAYHFFLLEILRKCYKEVVGVVAKN